MQYIIFFILFSVSILSSDTDIFSKKVWGSTPEIFNESQTVASIQKQLSDNTDISNNFTSRNVDEPIYVSSSSEEITTGWVSQEKEGTEEVVEKIEASPSSGWVEDISPSDAPNEQFDNDIAKIESNPPSTGWVEDPNNISEVVSNIINEQNTYETVYMDNKTNENRLNDKKEIIVAQTATITQQNSDKEIISSNLISSNKIASVSQKVNDIINQKTNSVEEVITTTKPHAKIIENSFDINNYIEEFLNFIEPLTLFVKENYLLASLLFATIFLFFYLLFNSPSKREDEHDFDDDFYIPAATLSKNKSFSNEKINQPNVNNINHLQSASILSQSQYTTLYGLINETFIYEKERILLSDDITQDRKNRELISLEWKSNQILHFSLPKLSSENSYQFADGVLELLDDSLTKDILIVALKDIIGSDKIQEADKMKIRRKLAQLTDKKEHV